MSILDAAALGVAYFNRRNSNDQIRGEILKGNLGALRIPSHSFELPRRPSCAAKLLCFLTADGFDPHCPRQTLAFFSMR
jgi:hypothetical protein